MNDQWKELIIELRDNDGTGTQQEQTRDCKTCNHSKDGKCAGTETCHECMWDSKYEPKQRTGRWEPNFRYGMYPTEEFWICSVCRGQSMKRDEKCPHCKTRMENGDKCGGRRMKIGDEVYIHGYVDEIRKDVVIIKNNGGYFGTDKNEIYSVERLPQKEEKSDNPYQE